MKRNIKGFTLIELLAVITVLAVILLVVTPSVTGIIWNSKKDTFTSSVKNIGRSIEQVMLEDNSIVCDGREYDIQMLEMSNLSRLTGIWSCTNKNEEFVYSFTVTDGEFYVSLTSGELDGDFDIEDYDGPAIAFSSDLINKYSLGDVISLSAENDVTTRNATGVTFSIYEDGVLVVENVTEYTYNVEKVVKLEVKYKAVSASGSVQATRTITINGSDLSDDLLEDLTTSGDGLYEFGDGSYRYVGDIKDNYVWYSGYLWRIVGLDDGSVKLVTDESITTLAYNKYKVNGAYYEDSYAQQWLESIFLPTLNNYSVVAQQGEICLDLASSDSLKRTSCDEYLTVKVGMLSLDEYNFSGGANGFLNTGQSFHTLTPGIYNYAIYSVNEEGIVGETGPTSTTAYLGIKPTIMLNDDIEYVSGDGTSSNPYMLSDADSAQEKDYLVERYSGEYIEINGNLWRIVSSDNQGTKIVLDSLYTNSNGDIQMYMWDDPNTYEKTSGIGQILNTEVYNDLFSSNDKNLVNENTNWYMATFMNATDAQKNSLPNPIDTLLEKNNLVNTTVGLLNVGEMFSTQNIESGTALNWLFSRNDFELKGDLYSWYLQEQGLATVTTYYTTRYSAVRPSVYILPSVKIESGDGTSSNPYKLVK